MANRKHSVRHLKRRRTYNVREAAKATGATPGTVRNWQKNGLEAVVGVYPAIFRGIDIIAFLGGVIGARGNRAVRVGCFAFDAKRRSGPRSTRSNSGPMDRSSGRFGVFAPNAQRP